MSVFYDPQSRKPQVWVIPFFILVTIIFIVTIYVVGQSKAKEKALHKEAEVDIFAK